MDVLALALIGASLLMWCGGNELYPPNRSPSADIQRGLRAINLIYGHQHVTVWCLTRVPADMERGYHARGWCTFEMTIASTLKIQ